MFVDDGARRARRRRRCSAIWASIPTDAARRADDVFGSIGLDYKLVLNVLALAVFAALFALTARRGATDPVCGMTVDRAKAAARWRSTATRCTSARSTAATPTRRSAPRSRALARARQRLARSTAVRAAASSRGAPRWRRSTTEPP